MAYATFLGLATRFARAAEYSGIQSLVLSHHLLLRKAFFGVPPRLNRGNVKVAGVCRTRSSIVHET